MPVYGWALTSQRLIFEAHKINVQVAATEVELSAIQSLRPCWTKFIGLVPLFPNSLAVFTAKGKEYRFVLINRRSWATAINEQKESINA